MSNHPDSTTTTTTPLRKHPSTPVVPSTAITSTCPSSKVGTVGLSAAYKGSETQVSAQGPGILVVSQCSWGGLYRLLELAEAWRSSRLSSSSCVSDTLVLRHRPGASARSVHNPGIPLESSHVRLGKHFKGYLAPQTLI